MKQFLFVLFLILSFSLFAQHQLFQYDETEYYFYNIKDDPIEYFVIEQNIVYVTQELYVEGEDLRIFPIQKMCTLDEWNYAETYIYRLYKKDEYLYIELWLDKLIYKARYKQISSQNIMFPVHHALDGYFNSEESDKDNE